MNYFIIAGEASGDLHASFLIRELQKRDGNARFTGFGGDLMEKEGCSILKHYRELAFMGLIPVLMNLHKISRNFDLAESELLRFRPDVLILVDYPGFNLRMAEFAKKHSIRVYYYISPKIWAWKTQRVHKIKKFVDEMFTIFPFETDFYRKYDYPVRFVGNPTIDELAVRPNIHQTREEFVASNHLTGKPIVALLAGSRKHEIQRILPVMAEVSDQYPDYQFVVAGVPSQPRELYDQIIGRRKIAVVFDQTYELLSQSAAALVASGTATLETCALMIPQVVCYRVEAGFLGTLVKNMLVKIPFFSLVNLIRGKEVVKELFQSHCTPEKVGRELGLLLNNPECREKMLNEYRWISEHLGGPGCSARAAELMITLLQDDNKKK